MHEEVLLRELQRGLREAVPLGPGERVLRVRIWIGALSHLSETRLRQSWPELVAGSGADTAELLVDVSTDARHPQAAAVVLASVDVAGP